MPDGRFGVKGVPATALSWADLAAEATLVAEFDFEQDDQTFPFGCHVAVVEVDVETGEARLVRHIAVDDCGTVLNQMLVEGQIHGGGGAGGGAGAVRGVRLRRRGQPADHEPCRLRDPDDRRDPADRDGADGDADAAQPVGGEGDRGVGDDRLDAGSAERGDRRGVTPGVRHIDMPLHPMRVWEAIRRRLEASWSLPRSPGLGAASARPRAAASTCASRSPRPGPCPPCRP